MSNDINYKYNRQHSNIVCQTKDVLWGNSMGNKKDKNEFKKLGHELRKAAKKLDKAINGSKK